MTTKWGRSFILTAQQTQTVTNVFSSTTGRNDAWSYDANGNVMSGGEVANTYDESGRLRQMVGSSNIMGQFEYDGDGRKAKRTSDFDLSTPTQTYNLYSSVIGKTLKEIGGVNGDTGFVYADGELVATRNSNAVYFQHKDPSLRSMRTTTSTGLVLGGEELDPNDVSVFNPLVPPQPHGPGSGGGNHGPGGSAAKVASLMDISLCDIGDGDVVPCSMLGDLQAQIQSSVGLPDQPPPAVSASAVRIDLDPTSTNHESAHAFALASSSGGEDEKKDDHVFGSVDISGSLDPIVVRLEALSSSIINIQDDRRRTHDPCSAVNADMGRDGGGYYVYEDAGWLRYGQPGMVAALTTFAANWGQTHPDNAIGVGDLSQLGGGANFGRHPGGGHPGGVIVDLRPMRNDNTRAGTNFNDATYSRDLTNQLIQGLAALPDVVSIRFNDPNIQNNKLVRDHDRFDRRGRRLAAVHDNHLHVVFRLATPCPTAY